MADTQWPYRLEHFARVIRNRINTSVPFKVMGESLMVIGEVDPDVFLHQNFIKPANDNRGHVNL